MNEDRFTKLFKYLLTEFKVINDKLEQPVTKNELNKYRFIDIRGILKEELRPLQGELEVLNDIKKIYSIDFLNRQFQKLCIEQKLLKLNTITIDHINH